MLNQRVLLFDLFFQCVHRTHVKFGLVNHCDTGVVKHSSVNKVRDTWSFRPCSLGVSTFCSDLVERPETPSVRFCGTEWRGERSYHICIPHVWKMYEYVEKKSLNRRYRFLCSETMEGTDWSSKPSVPVRSGVWEKVWWTILFLDEPVHSQHFWRVLMCTDETGKS